MALLAVNSAELLVVASLSCNWSTDVLHIIRIKKGGDRKHRGGTFEIAQIGECWILIAGRTYMNEAETQLSNADMAARIVLTRIGVTCDTYYCRGAKEEELYSTDRVPCTLS